MATGDSRNSRAANVSRMKGRPDGTVCSILRYMRACHLRQYPLSWSSTASIRHETAICWPDRYPTASSARAYFTSGSGASARCSSSGSSLASVCATLRSTETGSRFGSTAIIWCCSPPCLGRTCLARLWNWHEPTSQIRSRPRSSKSYGIVDNATLSRTG